MVQKSASQPGGQLPARLAVGTLLALGGAVSVGIGEKLTSVLSDALGDGDDGDAPQPTSSRPTDPRAAMSRRATGGLTGSCMSLLPPSFRIAVALHTPTVVTGH
jgi:hypothetical protein